ncbi:hypothetical protein [Lentzea sp. NBRC 102530]|uniref:hypothetical protein n=1 Tax=Lentzea sp. NBRC 102530 TaxID=3032201 RepID=UPI0024A0F123|nr:hypothetical protein [Lentzea sp. NBRC 102530]GLY51754.1 hypothetical protein Lesp01_54100 [Lentzea sp. NBRC 102530]
MTSQRQAFLADLEAELTAPAVNRQADGGTAATGGLGRRIRHLAATVLASASFFALSAGAASASQNGSAVVAADCFQPDFKDYTHTKRCGGLDIQRFTYLYRYSPNQVVVCYVFDHHSFTCNTWYYIGRKEACG